MVTEGLIHHPDCGGGVFIMCSCVSKQRDPDGARGHGRSKTTVVAAAKMLRTSYWMLRGNMMFEKALGGKQVMHVLRFHGDGGDKPRRRVYGGVKCTYYSWSL